jgi:chromosome transmission fidelity protein 1
MSVICSALQWVLDRRRQQEEENAVGFMNGKNDGLDDEPDWMRDFVANNNDQKKEVKRKIKKEKFRAVLGKSDNDCRKKNNGDFKKKIDEVGDDEDEFLLEEYESEDEKVEGSSVVSKRKASKSSFSSSSEDESGEDDEEKEEEKKFKVYFCSRTHSQLSQFVKELRKTVFADEIDVVSLGSRKNLCINQGLKFCFCLEVLFFLFSFWLLGYVDFVKNVCVLCVLQKYLHLEIRLA